MRTKLLTCKTFTVAGIKYDVVPLERSLMSKGAEFKCAKCGRAKCSKYQGAVSQSGVFEEVTIEFWHCSKCGYDFGTRFTVAAEVQSVHD